MAFIRTEKPFTARWFKNYSLIVLGSMVLAASFVFFISPYRIVPGGVYGIGIVIHYLTKGVFSFAPEGFPIGLMGLILNIPLTIIGIKILGPKFGIKTIIGFILSSVFIDVMTIIWGTEPLVHDDALLSSIFGGVLLGLGLGLIFMSQATSGGSDIVAMILANASRMPLGQALIIVDSVIVLFGLIVFQDWKIPLYSWIVIFITGRVIDGVLNGLSYQKSVFIISSKTEEIRDKILIDLDRGGTYLSAEGMFSGEKKKMIFTNISRREFIILHAYIKEIDPDAFVTVLNADQVLGEGFKSLAESNSA